MASSKGVLAVMKWTMNAQGNVKITPSSSPSSRTLAEDDFEFLLDALNDALVIVEGITDVSVGASLALGTLEVTFSLNADNLLTAQQAALDIFGTVNTVATQQMDERLGRRVEPNWHSATTQEAVLAVA